MNDRALAESTEGFFDTAEADLLMRVVADAPRDAEILEIGSYKGRSTRFLLAAMGPEQRLTCLDSFRVAAGYRGHSYRRLSRDIADPRLAVLPMTLRAAQTHLRQHRFTVVLVDADHSLAGVMEDLVLATALSAKGAMMLCHDLVDDLFPGVGVATRALVEAGVLQPIEQVKSLASFRVVTRPTWLVDPAVYRDGELP